MGFGASVTHTNNRQARQPLLLTLALGLSYIPLSPFLYWLPYALRGQGREAFFELPGYILLYFITPSIGLVAGVVFCGMRFFRRPRSAWAAYLLVLGLLAAGYLAFGLTETIPDYGD